MALRPARLLALLSPSNLLATLILLAAGIGGVTYLRLHLRTRRVERERERLEATVAEQTRMNHQLRTRVTSLEAQCVELESFVARLTTESRVADVRIVASHPGRDGVPVTTFEFTERGPQGQPAPSGLWVSRPVRSARRTAGTG